MINLVSSEEEGTPHPRKRRRRLDPLKKENWVNGNLDFIVGIDPAPRNFGVCKYSVSRDEITDWDWVDFQGVNKTKPSAQKIVDRLDRYINDNPSFFEEADLIVVEKQIVINAKNIRVQRHLMQRFPAKCIDADPKKIKEVMNQWTIMPTASYSKKKKATVQLGMSVITSREQKLLDKLKRRRKDLQAKINEHDRKLIRQGRTKLKNPRKIKTQPVDAFDALMIALCTACELLNRDIVAERIERKQRRETLIGWCV